MNVTELLLERFEGAHEKFVDRAAHIQISKQPHVMKYVIDAFMEDEEGAECYRIN